MRTTIILTLAAAALSACGPTPSAENAATEAAPPPAGPFFPLGSDKTLALVDSLGAPWAGQKRSDPLRDTKTGGTVRTITGMEGSAQVFAWPSGDVWQVRLIAGGAGGCGDIAALRAAIPKVIAGISPDTKMTAAQEQAISLDLIETSQRVHQLPKATITVIGGCRQWLTVKAS